MRDMKEPIIIRAVHLPYYGRNNPSQSIAEIEEYVMTNVRFIMTMESILYISRMKI